jgi:hypothetical protein
METLFNAYLGKQALGPVWARDKREAKSVAAAQYKVEREAITIKPAQTRKH